MLEPTLSIQLYEEYQMNGFARGNLFMEMGFFGVIAAPIASFAGECASRKFLVLCGLILTAFSVSGLGFAPTSNTANGLACILGFSLSTIAVPAIPAMLWDIPPNSNLVDGEVARVTNAIA